VRVLCLLIAALFAVSAPAQDKVRKKGAAKKQQVAHKKPTPEQIRKFKELEKKQAR